MRRRTVRSIEVSLGRSSSSRLMQASWGRVEGGRWGAGRRASLAGPSGHHVGEQEELRKMTNRSDFGYVLVEEVDAAENLAGR